MEVSTGLVFGSYMALAFHVEMKTEPVPIYMCQDCSLTLQIT